MTPEPCKVDCVKLLIHFPQPITSHRGSGKLSGPGQAALHEYLSNQGQRERRPFALRSSVTGAERPVNGTGSPQDEGERGRERARKGGKTERDSDRERQRHRQTERGRERETERNTRRYTRFGCGCQHH